MNWEVTLIIHYTFTSQIVISFTIPGKPIPLQRSRYSAKIGGFYDPSSTDKKQVWLQIARHKPKRPFAGDVRIFMMFFLERPKHHYRTGKYKHLLKDRCKDIIYHSVKPDLDNLCKFYIDLLGMNKGFYIDDSQICVIQAEKKYGEPKTIVIIEEI